MMDRVSDLAKRLDNMEREVAHMKDVAGEAASNAARVEVKLEHLEDEHKEWRTDDLAWRKEFAQSAMEYRKNIAIWIRWGIIALLTTFTLTNIHIGWK